MLFRDDELKECPFCGCAPMFWRYGKKGLEIRTKCSVSMKQKTLRFDLEWLQDKMIEKWNNRFEIPAE